MKSSSASRVADAEDHLRPTLREPARRADRRLGREFGQRAASRPASSGAFRERRRGWGASSPSAEIANRRISRSSSTGRSSIAMWPAPSSTTRRPSGSAPTSAIAAAGGVTRSCSPTTTRAGTFTRGRACRRSISITSDRPSVHTSDEASCASRTTWSTTCCGASGPNCVRRTTAPRTSAGLASTALRSRSTRRAAAASVPSRGLSSSVTEPIAPWSRSEACRADQHDPGHARPEELGALLRHGQDRHRPHGVTRRPPSGVRAPPAPATAATSRPIARNVRSP